MRKGDENMEKKKEPSGIQKAWRQLSIQNQIFLSMFLITLLGVGVLMNIVYKTSIDAIEQNYRASYQSTLKNSSRVMDMNLKNIVDVGRSFLNDEALQQILEKGNEYGGSKFASTDREKLRVIANEMASQQVWVNYIVFTDLYGHVYQLNNVNQGTYDFYNYYSDKDILEESWVKQAKAAQGKEIFFRDSILKAGTKKGFSYAKYMINPSDGQGMGYMVVGLSQKLLGKSFIFYSAISGGCFSLIYAIVEQFPPLWPQLAQMPVSVLIFEWVQGRPHLHLDVLVLKSCVCKTA